MTTDGASWNLAAAAPGCQDGDDSPPPAQLAVSPTGVLLEICAGAPATDMVPKQAWTSIDWGAHWTLESSTGFPGTASPQVGEIPLIGLTSDVAMTTSRDAWMTVDQDTLYETHNDGVTWTPAAIPGEFQYAGSYQVLFVNSTHGWVLGIQGEMFRTIDGVNWTELTVIGPAPGATSTPSA